ncbi:MAG: hypothetical protein AAF766_00330 [Cyanobacteria bacterium P01_D01_bin.14]
MLLKSWFDRRPRVLVLINLIQDLDLLLPLVDPLRAVSQAVLTVAVVDRAWRESPRIGATLAELGIRPQVFARAAVIGGLQPSLRGVAALITASESSCGPHRAARALTQRANGTGVATYTLQHGFENVGLTYSDNAYPIEAVSFESKTIFIWGDLTTLHPQVPDRTRHRCVPAGCPKGIRPTTQKLSFTHSRQRLVAVFENLHWERYDDHYRSQFVTDITQVAQQRPDTTFLLKPHHAGRWLTDKSEQPLPSIDNLVIADPAEPRWERFTAPALIDIADAAITTPSTVALDAARAGRPVAVVGYNLKLDNYDPLPILRQTDDWLDWLPLAAQGEPDQTAGQAFLRRRIIPGDAAERIVAKVVRAIAQP